MVSTGKGAKTGLEQRSAKSNSSDESIFSDFHGASILDGQDLFDFAGLQTPRLSGGFDDSQQATWPAAVPQDIQTQARPHASQPIDNSVFVPGHNAVVLPPMHTGLSDPDMPLVVHTGLSDPEKAPAFHTGWTDPEAPVFHTGWTDPDAPVFHTNLNDTVAPVFHTGLTDPEAPIFQTGLTDPASMPIGFDNLTALQMHPGTAQNLADNQTGSIFRFSTPTNLAGFPGPPDLFGGLAAETFDPNYTTNAPAYGLPSNIPAVSFDQFNPTAPSAILDESTQPLQDLPAFQQYAPIPRPVQDANGQWVLVFDPPQQQPPALAHEVQPQAPPAPPKPLLLRHSTSFATPSFSQHRASRPPAPPTHTRGSQRLAAPPAHARVQSQPPAPTLPVQTSNFQPDHPQRDHDRPWVRTNGRNKPTGSTRTGKITQYKPHEAYPVPNAPLHGPWVGPTTNKIFDYNSYGELKELQYTAAQLQDYMLNYSPTPNARLKVWIQRAPADSARRQPTSGSSKCRMAECPAAIYDSTITVGSFRLALDEQWHTHGMAKDPHVCAGFVHLYCAERFLDLRFLAQHIDLEPDTRLFNTEPNGRFAASLSQMASAADAVSFLALARAPRPVAFDLAWPQYPAAPVPPGQPFEDAHAHTLNCRMFRTKNGRMNRSKVQMLQDRGVKRSNQLAHLGDVEKAVKARHGATVRRRRQYVEVEVDEDEAALPPPPPRKRTKRVRVKVETPSTGGSLGRRHAVAPSEPGTTGAASGNPAVETDKTSPTSSESSRTLRRRKEISYAEPGDAGAESDGCDSLFGE